MTDLAMRELKRLAAAGDLDAARQLRRARIRTGQIIAFGESEYSKLASLGEVLPNIPEDISSFQEARDESCSDINQVLLAIFNASELHCAIRSYSKAINFAQFHTKDNCYKSFWHLALNPEKRMVLVRRELQYMADHGHETELKFYDLFQKDGSIFYSQRKFTGIGSDTRWYNDGVLAANDIRGYEFGSNIKKRECLSAEQILESFEEEITDLLV